ncbi:hypothetical protein Tco_0858579 [Tanacetum coccineum]|uniref:Uncharacterized protein n=1 Tax=Tanacetum coccineum TaxID=301880 RepID=A0ABQ5BBQ1_9ASTR
MEIIPDEEEVTINAIPFAIKSLRIINWKIHKEGKKSYYQIIRADGKSQMYRIFSQMLKSFDKEDLEDLYKLVKARYGSTRPVESMDYLLWNDMKIMFELHVEDEVWKLQNGYKMLEWKLYDSYGVHFLRMQSMQIYMLVEKKYPLTPPILSMMLEKKLQIYYESEMAYQLLLDAVRITAAQVYVNTALMKVKMDDPDITIGEYIRIEEEKARRRGHVYNWETATYGRIWYDEDVHYLRSFEKEFPAIVYNDALTCKSYFSPEPTLSPQNIDEFNLKNKTSLSECDGEEQNIIYFNDLFPFNVIYPNDLKSDKDNDNDKIDIKQPSEDISIIPSPNVINTDVDAYAQGSNKLLETSIDTAYPREPSEDDGIKENVDRVLHEIIPQIASNATNDIVKENLPKVIADVVIKERDTFQATVPALISKEFVDHAPKIIEELFKTHMKNNRKFEKSSASSGPCRTDAFRKRDHDDHQEDDAPPEGEKRAKRQKTVKGLKSASGSSSKQPSQGSKTYLSERQQQQQEWDALVKETVIDEDEVIPENESLELIEEFQNVDKHIHVVPFFEEDLEEDESLGYKRVQDFQGRSMVVNPTLERFMAQKNVQDQSQKS